MKKSSLLLLALLTSSAVLADPKRPNVPAPAPAVIAKYKAALAKGRTLQGAKKYADATDALNDALAAMPGDATVLGELGWTAYLAKDYKTAEAMTRKSLAAEGVPNVRGATLFNLGLIQEQNGDKASAIASYLQSIKARPNGVVRARLKKLDATAAAAIDPYAPHALTGYASIADLCKDAKATLAKTDALDASTCTCGEPIDDADTKPLTASKPFDELKTFQATCPDDMRRYNELYVAVKTGGKWYGEVIASTLTNYHGNADLTFNESSTRGSMLTVDFKLESGTSDGMDTYGYDTHTIAVFGLGPSHVPSAAQIKLHEFSDEQFDPRGDPPGKDNISINTDLAITWGSGATFTLAGKTTGLDKDTASNTLGSHTLVFR